ncbi:MAG: hypothetical protein LQ345_003723 [Seirophora villosa]|nr:MAG: hypothetical protein LQ345_003723 [Seirophora villosa]
MPDPLNFIDEVSARDLLSPVTMHSHWRVVVWSVERSKFRARAGFPAPDTETLVDNLYHAEVLIDSVAVSRTNLKHVQRGVEKEGEVQMGTLNGSVGGKDGNV